MQHRVRRYGAAGLLLAMATVGLTSGCATKRYVQTQVNTTANDITAKMEERDRNLQNSIDANSNQISELSGVSREHTQKIAALDSGLKTADEKASQAINIGQGAQTTATQAASQVSRLDMEFQNRNNYTEVNEHSVLFAFGSASIDKNGFATLDAVAQQVKDSPNAILVLEGRTDSTGDSNYNILLGEKRLEAVIRHLVVELSVPLHQIYKMSFGEARPVAANDSREGRARNRAVVIRVMEPKPGAGQAGQGGAIVSDTAPLTR